MILHGQDTPPPPPPNKKKMEGDRPGYIGFSWNPIGFSVKYIDAPKVGPAFS